MSQSSYSEIFRENRALIDSGASPVMNALRDRALACFEKYGFPDARCEEYLHTDISQWFAPDWGMNLGRVKLPVNPSEAFRCNVPNLSTQMHFLACDSYMKKDGQPTLVEGVTVGSLLEISRSNPQLVGKYLGSVVEMEKPGISALNTMFMQDGFMVHVPRNVRIDKPVQLVSLMSGAVSMLSCRRILVVLEQGAELRLLLCDHSSAARECLSAMVVECVVGDNARLELYDLEETSQTNSRVCDFFVSQGRNSSVHASVLTLHNGRTRNSFHSVFKGPGASLELDGIAISDGNQHVDNYSFVDHASTDCTSSELFKYILDDRSTGSFAGKVLVREGSQRTVSAQTNRNICLTRESRMFTQPQLEIYADDVKCSHGATVGQLDEKALFYMQQRGIPMKEARMLLMLAFAGEVLDRIPLDSLRSRLTGLVELRLRHGQSRCEGCNVCK